MKKKIEKLEQEATQTKTQLQEMTSKFDESEKKNAEKVAKLEEKIDEQNKMIQDMQFEANEKAQVDRVRASFAEKNDHGYF